MCGIAGIATRDFRPIDPEGIAAMCAAMTRRGPDEEAFFLKPGIGLGLRRLSIIGLEAGRQPVRNEDGSIVVVMNGEIYNYREVRKDLESRGHRFATDTDTETIAHLYEERGVDCVHELRGMFAFALWDARSRRLFLARDRLGIKPLYYSDASDRFLFASELKAILSFPEVAPTPDFASLEHLFMTGTTPPAASMVAGISKLEPAHFLTWSAEEGVKKTRYWRVEFRPDYQRSETETIEELSRLLEESVRMHLVSDVPVGAFLSGGVDSSAVVAMMARISSGRVRTYSVGFHEKAYDESEYARRVAGHLGTDHHEIFLDANMDDFIEDYAWHMDEPFGDPSAFPTFAVSRLAARDLKVVLSGDGGDELFAGYDHYAVEGRERRRDAIPAVVRGALRTAGMLMPEGMTGRNYLRHWGLSGVSRWQDSNVLFRADSCQKLFRPEVAEHVALAANEDRRVRLDLQTDADWLSQMQRHDIENYLPLDILTKVDRMSMANSLEARVPLLDYRFVELAATIPPELRIHRGERKYVLKKALVGQIPADLLCRKKQGFEPPMSLWARTRLDSVIRECLLSDESRSARFINSDYVARLLSMHERGRPLGIQLWTLLSFELWCRRFLNSACSVQTAVRQSLARGPQLAVSES